jgi:hypothetical protein
MESSKWITGHGVAQFQPFSGALPRLMGKTIKADIKNGISGSGFRVVLREQYGTVKVVYGAVAVELHGKQTWLTFNGETKVTVESGKQVKSDPVRQPISAGDALTLWLYNAGGDLPESGCIVPASHSEPGDFCGEKFTPEPFKSPP